MKKQRYSFLKDEIEKKDSWTSDAVVKPVVKNCDYAEKLTKKIMVNRFVMSVIHKMCKEVKTEWQMLLSGTVGDSCVNVTGYYVPKQSVTGSSVENLEPINKELIESKGIVAGIHSHSDMGVFFSPTDNTMNMGDIEFNIVVNNRNDVLAVQKVELPCGSVILANVKCEVVTEDIEIVGMDNVGKKVYSNIYNRTDYQRGKDYSRGVNSYCGYETQSDFFIHGSSVCDSEHVRDITSRKKIKSNIY